MRSPADMSVIQIEITNKCHLNCANCTRFVPHIKKPFIMTIADFEEAVRSLDGFTGNIGIMGGEPTLHPEFLGILKVFKELVPEKHRRQLWTAGYKWADYYHQIHDCFYSENISFNDHSKRDSVRHQPLLIGIEEVVTDRDLMWKYIDNCWIQNRWSASITPKGAYVCEVMAAMEELFDDDDIIPIEIRKDWWKIQPKDYDFRRQIRIFCTMCSGCLPVHHSLRSSAHSPFELISEWNMKRLGKTKKEVDLAPIEFMRDFIEGKTAEPGDEPGSLKDFPEWTPWKYRPTVHHEPGEGEMSVKEIRELQRRKTK